MQYRYRRGAHGDTDNRLLRAALDHAVPLIYLHGVAKGLYMVHGASIIEDFPAERSVSVALFPVGSAAAGSAVDIETVSEISRGYYLRAAKQRAGQAMFRESVLSAYGRQCTICRLRHNELLDAAHIIPDSEDGPLIVTNGLSLCKIHHAAYDTNILGVRPDHVAEIREDILDEVDGPMLRHGLQEVHGRRIVLPRSAAKRPDPDSLEIRYEKFRAAL